MDKKKDFVIELNNWSYKDFKAFRRAVAEENDEVFMPLLARVTVDWPFEGKPSVETIEGLGMADIAALLRAVGLAAERIFRQE